MKRVALFGGGHAHVEAVRAAAGWRDAAVTLVNDGRFAAYSGMAPGVVSGRRDAADLSIDLASLCAAHGVAFRDARLIGVDRAARRAHFAAGAPLAYDLASFDLGLATDLSSLDPTGQAGTPVKPIAAFLARWTAIRADMAAGRVRRLCVVGAGAAGVEIALAARAAASRLGVAPRVAIIEPGAPLASLNSGVRRRAMRALARRHIDLVQAKVVAVEAGGVTLEDGARIDADAVIVTGSGRPAGWFAASGLPLCADGSIATRDTLQLLDDDDLFAVGDCAHVVGQDYPKAGVFAVRQGPVLAANLRARLDGRALAPWRAQRDFLVLLDRGDGAAIGGRGRWLSFEGRWVLTLKDWIDERFVARFR